MNRIYPPFSKVVTAAVVFFTLLSCPAIGQQTLEGVVRIKVSAALASTLERKAPSTDVNGEVVTGVASLDQLNRQFRVKRLSRVFPDAGRNEAKHRRYGLHLWYEVKTDKSIPVSNVLQSYRSDKHIQKAEPVYKKAVVGSAGKNFGPRIIDEAKVRGALPGASNDPMLAGQWHYHNTGQTGGTPGADIDLIRAWKFETGRKEIVVAVTDGGIQTNHADLTSNMWVNADEIPGNALDDDNNGYVDDVNGYSFVHHRGTLTPNDHGTHVAGTIAAVTNNGIGVAGVAGGSGNADGVRLMSCAVFHTDTESDGFAEAYVYSADNGAVISQNSWGYTLPGVYEHVVLEAIDYFIAEAGRDENGNQTGPMAGGLVIFSAGNDNTDADFYPSYYAPVLAVASSTHRDTKAQYSNYGTWIDITAPGGETYETTKEGVISTLPGNRYGAFMGTSMACPHVSGVAALVLSKYGKPGFRPQALRERLLQSADNIYPLNPSYSGQLGAGRVNAAVALSHSDPTPPSAVSDLSVSGSEIGKITLTWTSPQDDNDVVVDYDLRYATFPITEANFHTARKAADVPPPGPPGTKETFTVKNLPGGVLFYFALRSRDFEGNVSRLSNVVSETSALAPSIVVTPSSLTENLKTAGHSTRTLTIRNSGQGPLDFSITTPDQDDIFASATPGQGSLSPGKSQLITVSFDASRLPGGTYRQEMIITNNDPQNSAVTVPLTLTVTNNGVPIATFTPSAIDFKSVQIGTALPRPLTISNEGSEPLIISKITSDNPEFTTGFSEAITLPAFEEAEILIYYAPATTGSSTGTISITTNDPVNPTLKVSVKGEGLQQPPIVISPGRFDETLAQGGSVTRKMVLQNNGSQERSFEIRIKNNRLAGEEAAAIRNSGARMATEQDTTTRQRLARLREKIAVALASVPDEEKTLITAVGPPPTQRRSGSAQGRRSQSNIAEKREYTTGFEEFTPGTIGEQQGWYTTRDWMVTKENPDKGTQHFRGTSRVSGTAEKIAISPYLFEYEEWELYPRYTHVTMRLNLDNARGTTWQVVPQDPWSYIATRVRFNADGTIDALVVDDQYESHWKRVPASIPAGYFDLTVECDNAGNDTTSFPVFSLFIDNRRVFSGTSLTSGINQVAFISPMETSGPALDMDELKIVADEYIPQFIMPHPVAGVIAGGQTADVNITFDASILRFGTYHSDVMVYLDERDSLVAPATLKVTGEPSISNDTYAVRLETEKDGRGQANITLTNTGGRTVHYAFAVKDEIPGLTITPAEGSLSVRGRAVIAVEFSGAPGLYESTILLETDIEGYPVQEIPLEIVAFDSGAVFRAPSQVQYQIMAGEISTRALRITNGGVNTVSFIADTTSLPDWITIDPASATVADIPLDMAFTFDARRLSPGTQRTALRFRTNDADRQTHEVIVNVNVLPDTVRGGRMVREVWTGIPGKEISSIPVSRIPDATSTITSFESPANAGDHYGSRIRGYVQAPKAGYYTFWIASNDNSELWLSTDEREARKKKIASVTGYTDPRQWGRYPSQKSQKIYLKAHQKYYIEALHKEGVGTDHVAVGWQLPDQTYERPIPGMRLFPYGVEAFSSPPRVTILTPSAGHFFSAPATIDIKASATDEDGHVVKVEFFHGTEKLGTDIRAPYVFTWKNVAAGNYSLLVKATDNDGATSTASVTIPVAEGQPCAQAGTITREQWNHVPGTLISSIPLAEEPTLTETLTLFEAPPDKGDNYGARIRGFLCVPTSGKYTFWISSNDKSELWLSTDSSPENRKLIASVSGYTNPRQWTKYPSQQSMAVALTAGQKYYIEALHKEGVGTDHLAVGWQLPDGAMERPVPGLRLLPFTPFDEPVCAASGSITREYWEGIPGNQVSYIPVHTAPDGVATLSVFEGPQNAGTNYGARISGYVCPPQTGDYYFWIASNDHSELWLSVDGDPQNKVRIAFVSGATAAGEWDKFASQKSAAIALKQGKSYYIEALHKQGVGTDHVAVGWQLPDGTMERPVNGTHLSPVTNASSATLADMDTEGGVFEMTTAESGPLTVTLYPNPFLGQTLNVIFGNLPKAEDTLREIEILQLTGQSVYAETVRCTGDCTAEIALRDTLASGVYLVKVRIGGKEFTRKLVVP